MGKQYTSAPLPFMGQKRRFAKEFIKVLKEYPDGTTFVDLFGGSGLLSHIAKCQKPNSKVVYNDFDGYCRRLDAIPQTNALLGELRQILAETPRDRIIKGEVREHILECIARHERLSGYIDYITLSTSLLFSMNYCLSLGELRKARLYNCIRLSDIPEASDYLDGLTITSCDYRQLVEEYCNEPDVVFLVDPPYLSTEVGTYDLYWHLSDYLDVLSILDGHAFIYFTSDKSSIIELCDWMGRHPSLGNPFGGCKKIEIGAKVTHTSSFTDIMLYKNAA